MTKLILSTSNVMVSGPAVLRHPMAQKSNIELTSALRENFRAAQELVRYTEANGLSNGSGKTPEASSNSPSSWTLHEGSTVYIPNPHLLQGGLAEERSQYEITVKLFFLANNAVSSRSAQTREAIDLVLKELQMPSIDLLIVSYPGIAFDAEDEGDEELDGVRTEETELHTDARTEDIETMIKTWESLESLHDRGAIAKLGVAEFSADRLAKFLQRTRVRPSVNQINVRDCCVVPRSLILYAKKEKIELLTHNDCTNILPSGTLRELLDRGDRGAGVLAESETAPGLKGDLEPQLVIKYTAVVKNRGVVENKGYFALAEVSNGS